MTDWYELFFFLPRLECNLGCSDTDPCRVRPTPWVAKKQHYRDNGQVLKSDNTTNGSQSPSIDRIWNFSKTAG